MNAGLRLLTEYGALAEVLPPLEMGRVLLATAANAGAILKTKKLTPLDRSMSRNLSVTFQGKKVNLPLADVDAALAAHDDNPTFGNLREIYARNCYLKHLPLKAPVLRVLDLGANRGMFSLLALAALGAQVAVGVEPVEMYTGVSRILLEANQIDAARAPRYVRFVTNPTTEKTDPEKYISVTTILREQNIERFDLVKIDIEGYEKDIFEQPEWLEFVDNVAVELHPHFVGDLSVVPDALKQYGFAVKMMDQGGNVVDVNDSMFLVASRDPSLLA
jgi:hypothetical protein